MDEGFIKRVVAAIKCGICSQRYEDQNVRVLGHYGDLWFLSVYCSICRSQGLVAAVIREGQLPQVITDLTEAEFGKFREMDVVSDDDLLDIHNFLKDFDGDFSYIFCKE